MWELRACRSQPLGRPPAHVAKGYLVQTCIYRVPARAEGTGRIVPFTSPVWAFRYSCLPTHSSPPVLPIACSPNGSPILAPSCSPRRTWLSVVSQVSDHKLCSCLTAPQPSELAQVLAKMSFTCFLGHHSQGQGKGFSVVSCKGQQTCSCPFLSTGKGDGSLHLHHFSLCFLARPAPARWMEDDLFSGRKALG